MSDGCVFCGRPVHRKSWHSVMRRYCLLRTMRWDCTLFGDGQS